MTKFRYIRMARNDQNWTRPHGGRRGGADFVGTQGLGHEDWNFAKDVWKDGRYHLFLRSTPADFDKGQFNFVLGAHGSPGPLVIGFVENSTFGLSELPESVLLRRAQEVFALNEDNSLGSYYGGLSVQQIASSLRQTAHDFRVSVAPDDLHILAQPVPMPPDIYQVSHPGYRALNMTEDEYKKLRESLLLKDITTAVDHEEEASFPEGLLVEKLHRSRERNRRVVELAKKRFIDVKGRLFCEACGLDPEKHFRSAKLHNRIIEAHHNVPLFDDKHDGETKVSDLRMLCPTCHRAIHTIRPWQTVEELRKLLSLCS